MHPGDQALGSGSHPTARPSHPSTLGALAPLGRGLVARTPRGAYAAAAVSRAALSCDVGLAGQHRLSNRQQSTGADVIVSKCSPGASGGDSLAVLCPWLCLGVGGGGHHAQGNDGHEAWRQVPLYAFPGPDGFQTPRTWPSPPIGWVH